MRRLPISRFSPILAAGLLLGGCQSAERKPGGSGPAAEDSTASFFEDGPDAPLPAAGPLPDSSQARLRIVSLKAVDRILAACPQEALCADSLFLRLGGITAVAGVAFDERARDALLLGYARKGHDALHLEDLVAALRNAWLAYVRQKGNRITYLHPGVSLEPTEPALKDLRRIARDIAQIDAAGGEKALARWQETCRKPFRVSVAGLPPRSRFTGALLRADYALKGLANGSENLALHGFPGMAELRKIRFQGEEVRGTVPAPPQPSLTRYWFHPGSQEWETAEGIVILKRCPIMLMTEEMYDRIRASDSAAAAPSDDLAEAFAYGFTRMYDKVAEVRPEFRELESLFRLVAAAKLMRDRFPESDAKAAFPALFETWELPSADVADAMPGRPDLQHFDHARITPEGMEIDRRWLPSCGGITVAVEPAKAWIRRVRDQGLARFRKAVLGARPSEGAWTWDVPSSPQDYWGDLRERMRMQELGRRFPDLAFYRLRRAGEDERSLELVDEDGIVLRSGQAAGILEEIGARAEARKVGSVFVELAAWPADQVEAFRGAAGQSAKAKPAAWTLVTVADRPGWLNVDNPLFTPGSDWEQGEPPMEPVQGGPYKGWQRLTFRFLTSAGGKTVPTALHVMVKSPERAARLREQAVNAFRTKLFIAYSPLSAVFSVVAEFRETLPVEDRKDVRIVEDEAGLFDLG
jgi:hypothetical protein